MVTDFPDNLAAPALVAPSDGTATGMLTRAVGAIQQFVCALHGHDNLMHFDQKRMFLRCSSCGRETPGWEIDKARPQIRFQGDRQRQTLTVRRLADTRKIA